MNRTSLGCRFVRIAARSPARWMTGPEVARKPTPSSRAMIWARVVLPRPGGPCSRTWSSESLRVRVASMKMARFSREARWPDEFGQALGAERGFPVIFLGAGGGYGAVVAHGRAFLAGCTISPFSLGRDVQGVQNGGFLASAKSYNTGKWRVQIAQQGRFGRVDCTTAPGSAKGAELPRAKGRGLGDEVGQALGAERGFACVFVAVGSGEQCANRSL